ncbi:putative NBD/HSP70 family sugar kinase [Thioclava sp. ES.031]|uniref:ROK family transcriptional regulator n=1 Tax=Thioclava sp. ES.031 TaxID=1798203 RepID=UPI000BF3A1F9|nr:ROK family transcriptional regulator [Thioclava sp. ES.031]PFG62149.1 putative NBD/HSP70 family sugar kinase [Thioclava sp. ES.031]
MTTARPEKTLNAVPLMGTNQLTVRDLNERLVLHLIRRHGTLTKAEATRATGLSANAVSEIFKALEQDDLLLRGDPVRGRVGQPSVPMRLNPEAKHYLGLKIGRRSFDMVVIDFTGAVMARRSARHDYPTRTALLSFIKDNLRPLLRSAKLKREDVAASGIAIPSELWHWAEDFDAPAEELERWRSFDAQVELDSLLPGPISVENDGTAACRGELVFGPPNDKQDYIYFFIGTFIGGGVVLNGSVFSGRSGNSGGFGPLRIPDEPGGHRLIDHASLSVLERLLADQQSDPGLVHDDRADWSSIEPALSLWITRAARSLAHAIVSAQAVIDFEAVIIDGALPQNIRDRIVTEVDRHFSHLDLQGVYHPEIRAGHFGSIIRAVGAAAHSISTDFMIDQNTLLRKAPPDQFSR